MNLKSLFINDENDKTGGSTTKVTPPVNQFPSPNQFPQGNTPSFTPVNDISNDHLTTLTEKYNTSFEGLNQEGYDFFEFFQAIISSNSVDNPQMYGMAITMAKSMDKSVTKDKLVSSSDYYINGLNNIYNTIVETGNNKKQNLINQKESETHNLTVDLAELKSQLDRITNEINSKQSQLNSIGTKYQPDINEIDSKMRANDYAKNIILTNIQKVKSGIVNNIK
jgi:hypothetical protein